MRYSRCVRIALSVLAVLVLAGTGYLLWQRNQDATSGMLTYRGDGFAVRYQKGWFADADYVYDHLGPEEPTIPGVKFLVPIAMIAGTNLTTDTGVSVEWMPGMPACRAEPFLLSPQYMTDETIEGVTYSVASSTDAGAGNRYEEMVYALKGTDPCLAVRYFIHYSALGNFDEGAVAGFDRAALIASFDAVRDSLLVKK